MAVRLAVAFEVFEGVFQFNAMVLQESIDFHAGLEAQQAAQLGSGDLAGTVGFERQGFQGSAGQVLALCREGREEFVWKRNGDVLHGFRIPEESLKSTSGSGAGDAGVPGFGHYLTQETLYARRHFLSSEKLKRGAAE